MPLYVATNSNALAAQNNLTANRVSLDTSLNRLSSGLRINTAADDSAGLAISTRLQNQINGLTQGGQNANSGISLANVADSALAQVTSNLQRIRTLAVQSQNSTNSTTDRAALDAEVQQRLAEIQRISTQTSYNGTKLLDGSFSGAQFQVGANVGENITLSASAQNLQTTTLGSFVSNTGALAVTAGVAVASGAAGGGAVTTAAIGNTATGVVGNAGGSAYQGVSSTAITAGSVQINGTNVLASAGYAGGQAQQSSDSAYAKAAAINASGISGLTATANTTLTFDGTGTANLGAAGNSNFVNVTAIGTGTLSYGLSINGTSVYSTTLTSTGATASTGTITNAQIAAGVNQNSSTTGVSATLNSNGTISFNAADGRNVVLAETYSNTAGGAGVSVAATSQLGAYTETANTVGAVVNTATYRGQVTLNSTNSLQFNTSANNAIIGLATTTTVLNAGSSLSAQNVQSITASNNTIYSVDSAIAAVNGFRATYGAIVNRLTSAVSAIGSQVQQLTTANGRIVSADFAAETTNLSTTQIIQQAGTSILAQANSLPQGILKLLQ
jgi:flagellin